MQIVQLQKENTKPETAEMNELEAGEEPAFVFSQLGEISLEVVFAIVIIVVGALILSGLGASSSITANSTAANTINNGQSLLNGITSQFGLTGTIIGLMILLAVVVFFLGRRTAGKGL